MGLMGCQRCLLSPTMVFGEAYAVPWVSYSLWVCGFRGPTDLCGICFPLIIPFFSPLSFPLPFPLLFLHTPLLAQPQSGLP